MNQDCQAQITKAKFVRWQQVTLKQFTYVLNVTLGLTTASLGFSVSLLTGNGFILEIWGRHFYLFGCIFLLLSIMCGLICSINRLIDFRKTAEITRKSDDQKATTKQEVEKLRSEAKRLGERSWLLLYFQISFFVAGILAIVISIAITLREKLF